MKYTLLINGSPFLQGDLLLVIGALAIILILLMLLSRYLKSKLTETNSLKSEFISIIAHKFRTPLSKIKWITEELFKGETEPFKKESIGNIRESNENLIKLTNTLLELTDSDDSSKGSYEFEKIQLCDFVRKMSESYKNAFHEKNIFFSTQCPVEEIMVKADRARLEFVLETVLQNAYTYTRPGQKVDVTVGKDGRKGVISVTDHGIGIAPGDMPFIFKTKFFRSSDAEAMDTEGFGVGLFLAHAIMKRLSGSIEAYSAGRNQGATFNISVPTA